MLRAIRKYLEDRLAEEIEEMNVKADGIPKAELDKETQKMKLSFKTKMERKSKA